MIKKFLNWLFSKKDVRQHDDMYIDPIAGIVAIPTKPVEEIPVEVVQKPPRKRKPRKPKPKIEEVKVVTQAVPKKRRPRKPKAPK